MQFRAWKFNSKSIVALGLLPMALLNPWSHCAVATFCWRHSSPLSPSSNANTRFLLSSHFICFPHMNSLHRIAKSCFANKNRLLDLPLQIKQPRFDSSFRGRPSSSNRSSSPSSGLAGKFGNGEDEWNDTWESAWLPEDLSPKNKAPWESDVNFPSSGNPTIVLPSDVDLETKAFVEDMSENWNERRKGNQTQKQGMDRQEKEGDGGGGGGGGSLYSLENIKKDYRLKKQRIHANLWMKEIEKQEEARLGDSITGSGDDIERLMDSCSEIFESVNDDLNHSKVPSSSEFRNKPDGWETTSKGHDGNVWEMTQREEDILLQEFDRRVAYNKFQIASFIKTHIFSRRRPIDGWKYMIEEFGPNAKKGKGSVSRLPSLSDTSTQPFKEERAASSSPSLPRPRRI